MCGTYTPEAETEQEAETSTEYKYAVRSETGKYVTSLNHGSTHFSWYSAIGSIPLEDAVLFNSATEAEIGTASGRKATSEMNWVVVPVKMSTTTTMKSVPVQVTVWEEHPEITTTRELA